MEEFLKTLNEEGFGDPVRSVYFFWIDRYIVEKRDLQKERINRIVRGMVDGIFIKKCEIYDFADDRYMLVCRFTLNLYDIVFFLPSREGYLSGMTYFMRIKGKIDLVSLRNLFKVFRSKMSSLA